MNKSNRTEKSRGVLTGQRNKKGTSGKNSNRPEKHERNGSLQSKEKNSGAETESEPPRPLPTGRRRRRTAGRRCPTGTGERRVVSGGTAGGERGAVGGSREEPCGAEAAAAPQRMERAGRITDSFPRRHRARTRTDGKERSGTRRGRGAEGRHREVPPAPPPPNPPRAEPEDARDPPAPTREAPRELLEMLRRFDLAWEYGPCSGEPPAPRADPRAAPRAVPAAHGRPSPQASLGCSAGNGRGRWGSARRPPSATPSWSTGTTPRSRTGAGRAGSGAGRRDGAAG